MIILKLIVFVRGSSTSSSSNGSLLDFKRMFPVSAYRIIIYAQVIHVVSDSLLILHYKRLHRSRFFSHLLVLVLNHYNNINRCLI